MPRPTSKDLLNDDSFFDFVKNNQKYNTNKGVRSTASINGSQTYAATTYTVSDILQGNLTKVNPQDQLLVLNKALTDSLGNLYNDPAQVHGFSTFTSTTPNLSGVSNGGANGQVGSAGVNGIGATVPETFVQNLPLVHSNGAIIWQGRGKASEEMHLPTSESIQEDTSQHLQYEDLPINRKHPWNMDRVGGPIGGGSTIYNNVDDAETILGERAGSSGQHGAFGFLDPQSEQFYCSMAWPYNGDPPASFIRAGRADLAEKAKTLKKSDYQGKRVLVWSVETKRGVVCTPGDWGTQPYWSNGAEAKKGINGFYIGLAPDVHYALGTKHGAEVMIRWMPDDTPLGPYGSTNGGIWGGIQDAAADIRDSISSVVNLTVEELKYAGDKIASHPNLRGDGFKKQLREGFLPQVTDHVITVFKKEINRGFYYPSLLNYLWIIMEAGFILDTGGGGGYVHRTVNFQPGARLSNHSYGAAIDIMKLGRGTAVSYTDPRWRSESDALFTMLASLGEGTKPAEVGSSFAYKYSESFNVYKEDNATHMHIGFSLSQVGSLIPQLKKQPITPRPIRGPY